MTELSPAIQQCTLHHIQVNEKFDIQKNGREVSSTDTIYILGFKKMEKK